MILKKYINLLLVPFFIGCLGSGDSSESKNSNIDNTSKSYVDLRSKELKNAVAYIPPQCYTKTEDNYNPCYSCHTKGEKPNFIDDSSLQESYDFLPTKAYRNNWSNLFKDRTKDIEKISNQEIVEYISKSNYIENSTLVLAQNLKNLPKEWDYNGNKKWDGYMPDCYFNFDAEGFDKNLNGDYTGWRAFAYYPFLGTFFPTNGSTDDVLIRLSDEFMQDENGNFNLEIYKINLAIIESLIKAEDIKIDEVDENLYGVDLDKNGELGLSSKITYEWIPLEGKTMSYIGKAKEFLENGKIHLARGLYPENTEFLHSVRYISENLGLSERMKELRYAKKTKWKTYTDHEIFAINLDKEAEEDSGSASNKVGNVEDGMQNGLGWVYQGFIEDKDGELRPQTYEESVACIACHSTIGAITDSTFVFKRKYDWSHWSSKSFVGIKDRILENGKGEYSFYLENNRAGDEFRENSEVIEKFFYENGDKKVEAFENLKNDISYLLLPSKARALELNKAYKVIVDEQSFIYGRDAIIKAPKNIHRELKENQSTGLEVIE